MGEGIVDALAQSNGATEGAAEIVVANRTVERARALAGRVGGVGVGMAGLVGALEAADAVLLSTGSSLPVLDVEKMTSVRRPGQMRLGQMRLGQMRLGPMRCAALWSSSM